MGLIVVTPPAEEPVTLTEAKAHLRVDISADDDYITACITAARIWAENFQRRAYVTTVFDLALDIWPENGVIELPRPPLVSVGSVKYYDEEETEYTFASSSYIVDTIGQPGRIVLKWDSLWPSETLRRANGVIVRFTAGYGGADDVPEVVKQAMKLVIGDLYENRENTIVAQGISVTEAPLAAKALLWQERNF